MPVKVNPDGSRCVEMVFEAPGTPEELWRLMATGPGMTLWFTPVTVEERKGGRMVFDMGGGMQSTGEVTEWEPPKRLGYVEKEWMPGAPPCTTEIVVTPKAGGTCVVRMVHCLFTDKPDWDDHLNSFESNWPGFFDVLKLYQGNFAGMSCRMVRVMGPGCETEVATWEKLSKLLDLGAATAGRKWRTPDGAPRLAGERVTQRTKVGPHDVMIKLTEPGPGTAFIGAFACMGMVMLTVLIYLYGEEAGQQADSEQAKWEAWLAEHFPAPPPEA